MYDKQVVRRRRAALAVLVALSIGLLTVYFGEGANGLLHGFQRGAQEVLQPIETGISRATKPFRDLVGWSATTSARRARTRPEASENAELREQVARARAAEDETRSCADRSTCGAKPGFPYGHGSGAAQVIARSPTVWSEVVQIDAGSSDGIKVNQPVITNGAWPAA